MDKKEIIRVGDIVEIVNPKWVKRVGYNLVWTDLIEEVENDPRTYQAMVSLGFASEIDITTKFGKMFSELEKPEIPFQIVRAIALERVKEREFGGDERKIHYYDESENYNSFIYQPGFRCEVVAKRLAKTGWRFGASGGQYGGPDYEYWYEPGGLSECKTHILLKLQNGEEIERENVKLVKIGSK